MRPLAVAPSSSRRKKLFTVFVVLALALVSAVAEAHTIGLSTGEYRAKNDAIVVKLAFARGEIAALVPAIDENHDGHLTAGEVAAVKPVLAQRIFSRIAVSAGGARCYGALTDAALTEEDGLFVQGRFDCAPGAGEPFDVDVALLRDLARGHRHVARAVAADAIHDEVLDVDHRTFTVPRETSAVKTAEPGVETGGARSAWSFFVMGIEHILTGYDHLAFLLGLVLVRGKVRSLAVVVTAFTLAHSLTLAVAVLGIWSPSPRIVEPAIALSIVYVGVENFFVADVSRRWRITFPFGLVHGFGFAGALAEVGLAQSSVPAALVSFNLGVEAGQLAVLALILPLVFTLRSRSWFERRAVRLLSAAVALAGGVWFVGRIVFG